MANPKNHIVGVDLVDDTAPAGYPLVQKTIYLKVFASNVVGAIDAVYNNEEAVVNFAGNSRLEIGRAFDASDEDHPTLSDIIEQFEA